MIPPIDLNQFDSTTQNNLRLWLQGEYDRESKEKIKKLIQTNPKEVTDAFYTNLSFGTGGVRAIMGVGSNRLNVYTIQALTQGLAYYLQQQPKPSEGYSVCIGYDSRHNSKYFAEEAAKVLAGNHIKVFLCENLRPTPFISFTCRHKQCSAGIMITASHNPPEYNGYKVFWSDGGQALSPHDEGIVEFFKKITSLDQIKKESSLSHPLIEYLKEEADKAYLEAIKQQELCPKENWKLGKELKIAYTSLHGTGITLTPQCLQNWGFTNICYVNEQIIPDGNFPTVQFPNPEEKSSLDLGIRTLIKNQADILIATDPDADRVGVVVRHKNRTRILNGNELACICLEHICKKLSEQEKMPKNGAFIKSIGMTELFQSIADYYQKPCFNVLTGFKYIAEKIRTWENDKSYQFIFGGEESLGYLLGTQTRDKDGILSAALICEIALEAKLKGKTMVDLLNDLWVKYGFYEEKILSIYFDESKEGREKMSKTMELLRKCPPKEFLGVEVIFIEDYKKSVRINIKTGHEELLNFPISNFLLFKLADNTKLIVRPSGTEPKIKLHCGVVEKKFHTIAQAEVSCHKKIEKILDILYQQLKGI